MVSFRIVLTFGLLGALIAPLTVQAAELITAGSTNDEYRTAVSLGSDPDQATVYGRLYGTGDARYFVLTVTTMSRKFVRLETADIRTSYEPRLVVYEPSSRTIGPTLPMTQPPSTLASIYSINEDARRTEGPLRTSLVTRIDREIVFENPGRYYLAIYNAGRGNGAFRLTVSANDDPRWSAGATMKRSWLTSLWFGPQSGALTWPIIIVVAGVIAWLIIRHVPAPPRLAPSPTKRKRTVTNVKRY